MNSSTSLGAELLAAVSRGDAKSVRDLLAQGADPNFRDVLDRGTALHRAAEKGFGPIAAILLDHGADPHSCRNDSDSSPLGVAVLAGHVELVRLLVARGARLSQGEIESGLLDEARTLGLGSVVDVIETPSRIGA